MSKKVTKIFIARIFSVTESVFYAVPFSSISDRKKTVKTVARGNPAWRPCSFYAHQWPGYEDPWDIKDGKKKVKNPK